MSLLHQTVYQSSNEKSASYGFILALVCVVLALVLAGVMFTPVAIGSGIGDEVLFVGP